MRLAIGKISAIARQLGMDRKTVRRYIERGLEPPSYGPRPRQQKSTDPFLPYLRPRLAAYPSLTAVRLWRELRDRGYAGGYTAVKRTVREVRPEPVKPFGVLGFVICGYNRDQISSSSRRRFLWFFSSLFFLRQLH